jgi:hypothetical protein
MQAPTKTPSFQPTVLAQSIREILRNPEKYSQPFVEYSEDE